MFVKADGVDIRGESSIHRDGREDSIEVVELNHEVRSPIDGVSGMRSGHREHRPLLVVARIDRATPLMYRAWMNNTECEVTIKFWRANPDGREEQHFTIQLTGVSVASIKMHVPSSVRAETASLPEQVEYAFQYEEITWIAETFNIEANDYWRPGMQ